VFSARASSCSAIPRAAAEEAHRPVQHAADRGADLGSDIVFEIRRLFRQRAEDEAGIFGGAQARQRDLVLAEFGRHAALPLAGMAA
jgi:hypothetical protein